MNKGVCASIAAAMTGILFSLPMLACGADYSWKLGYVDGLVSVHTEEQAEYLGSSDYAVISADGSAEKSRPATLRLSFSYGDFTDYTVELAQGESFDDCVIYRTDKTHIDVYNLYLETAYAWRVTARLSDGTVSVSDTEYFITAGDAPRNIYVDGVTNVRDLGGWAIGDDARVRQGLIYRCGRLNKSRQPNVEIEITADGVSTMRDVLGIKTEIDLRRPDALDTETGGITSSPLGDGVAYRNVPMDMDVDNTDKIKGNADSVKEFFEILGDKNNYPMIFHCDIGTDRTGMLAFLVNGLLGVSETDLYRDYLFSNFGAIGGKRALSNITDAYVKALKAYRGDTLAQKIENYLVDEIGVSETDIAAVREILTAEE